jgi:hypothetical protein
MPRARQARDLRLARRANARPATADKKGKQEGRTMSRRIRNALTHHLNPLHLYCRLRDMGLSGALARSITRGYERLLYRPMTHPHAA